MGRFYLFDAGKPEKLVKNSNCTDFPVKWIKCLNSWHSLGSFLILDMANNPSRHEKHLRD